MAGIRSTSRSMAGVPARETLLAVALAVAFGPAWALDPGALPTGGTVASGTANIQQAGNRMNVQQQSARAILDWTTFNVGAQAAVNFQQPGASSVVLNRVAAGGGASQIFGSLTANGQLFLVNPAGALFGRGAQVNVGALVASSLDITNDNFLRGNYRFTSSGGVGSIVNQGTLSAAEGGYVALLAPQVRNEGVIAAQLGTVAIGAGNAVTLDVGATGLLSMQVEQSSIDALIENKGLVRADGGFVFLSAKAADRLAGGVINHSGEIRAFSVTERDGVIRLEAGDVSSSGSLNVNGASGGRITVSAGDTNVVTGMVSARGAHGRGGEVRLLGDRVGLFDSATVDASGETGGGLVLVGGNYQGKGPEANASRTFMAPDARIFANATGDGKGGTVVLWADDLTRFSGSIEAKGGPRGGDGGLVETSAKKVLRAFGNVNANAPKGAGGLWLLDPNDITISGGADSNSTFGAGVFDSTDDGAVVNNVTLGNAITNGTNIKVVTQSAGSNTESGDIFVQAAVVANLAGGDNATLSLVAQRNIDFNAAGSISSGAGMLTVNLNAGTDVGVTNTPGTMPSSITMAPGSSINTGGGNFTATANSAGITLGAINTGGGGTLTVNSLNGAIAQVSPLSIGGSSTFNAGSNSITLASVSNALLGPVSLNNNGANNVSLTNSFPTTLAASTVGSGTLAITSAGGIAQVGALVQAGGAGAVSLDSGSGPMALTQPNDFTGTVNLSNLGANSVSITDANALTLGTLSVPGGSLTVISSGALNLGTGLVGGNLVASTNAGGPITQAGPLSIGGTSTLTASGNNITLTNAGNDFAGIVTATGLNLSFADNNTLSLLGTVAGGDVTISAGGQVNLGTGTIAGNVSATTSNAPIMQTGALTVTGATTVNAGTAAVTLTQANDFQGTVTATGSNISLSDVNDLTATIAASGSAAFTAGGNLVISGLMGNGLTTSTTGGGATMFGVTAVTGNLLATSAGVIGQTGTLTVSGTSNFNSGASAINLTNAANDFQGLVTASGSSIALVDANALSANLLASAAGSLSAAGNLSVGGSVLATLSTTTTSGGSTSYGALSVGSNLSTVSAGAVGQTGAVSVGGTTTISAGTNAITLANGSNNFGGAVSLTGGTTQVTDVNALTLGTLSTAALTLSAGGALNLGTGTVAGNLSAGSSGGGISQAGPLTVAGTATIAAGAGPISLTAANDFQGVVTLSNSGSGNPAAITDVDTLTFSNQVLGGSFTANAPTIIAHDTTTTGPQVWNGNVTFNSTETTNGGAFTVNGNTTLGNGLTVNAGTGNVTFQGSVNGTQTLSINTTGTTTFNGAIGSGVTVNISGAAAAAASTASVDSTSAQTALAVATVGSEALSAGGTAALGGSSSGTSSAGVAAATAAASVSGPPPAPLTAATSSELGTVRITASSGVSRETIRQIDQQIAQARAQMFSPALDQLTKDPSVADVPECSGPGSSVCVKQGKARKSVTLADAEPTIDKRVAVLFGNDKYLAPIPGLQTPIHDVEEIGKVLKERLGYDVRVVRNASRQDIVNELNNLVTEVDEDDSVIVYYAGHGYQAEKEKGGGGYWIPVDANNNDASTWISNSAISKFLTNMASRQVMLVSDSCYSGTLAQEQKVRTSESTVFDRKEILRKRSVLVMSSGGNEPVADGGHENHSLFAYHLIRNLSQVDGDLVGGDIHQRVREAISKEYPQDPQYGAVLTAGHAEGGEYLIGKPK